MMAKASAAAHQERAASPASVKRPIWRCQEPSCDGSRDKNSDGINWTCKKCGKGTNSNKTAEGSSKPAQRRPVLVSSTSEPSPRWMAERRIAGVRTCLSRR